MKNNLEVIHKTVNIQAYLNLTVLGSSINSNSKTTTMAEAQYVQCRILGTNINIVNSFDPLTLLSMYCYYL